MNPCDHRGVAEPVAGPLVYTPARRRVTVLAVTPPAIYLVDPCRPGPGVLALVTADAVRLPNAVVIDMRRNHHPFTAILPGEQAIVGRGSIEIPDRLHVQVISRRQSKRTIAPLSVEHLAVGVGNLDQVCAETHDDWGLRGLEDPVLLEAACAAGNRTRAIAAAGNLIGRGPGLTPSGDDALAGLLVAMRLLGEAVPEARHAIDVADALGTNVTGPEASRTTALSAALLWCASRGYAAPEAMTVLYGVVLRVPLLPAVRRLLTVGHSSGADLLWGLLAGCRAVAELAITPLSKNCPIR